MNRPFWGLKEKLKNCYGNFHEENIRS